MSLMNFFNFKRKEISLISIPNKDFKAIKKYIKNNNNSTVTINGESFSMWYKKDNGVKTYNIFYYDDYGRCTALEMTKDKWEFAVYRYEFFEPYIEEFIKLVKKRLEMEKSCDK